MTLFVHRNAGGRCPCGAENAACGPPSDVVPVGQVIEEVAAVSGPLKKYRVQRNGFETVMKLNDADAERLGVALEQPDDGVSTIEPVASAEDGEAEEPTVAKPLAKRRAAANKARSGAENKAADGGG